MGGSQGMRRGGGRGKGMRGGGWGTGNEERGGRTVRTAVSNTKGAEPCWLHQHTLYECIIIQTKTVHSVL